jgi:hypothetical protein
MLVVIFHFLLISSDYLFRSRSGSSVPFLFLELLLFGFLGLLWASFRIFFNA